MIGEICRMPSRCWAVSMNPPVPGVDASTKLNDDTHSEFAGGFEDLQQRNLLSCNRFGSTCTCSCRSRWPQIATLATPGTPIKRGIIVQRASTPIWIRETSFEDSPIIMTRPVDDRGWSMVGGFDTCGSANAWVRRSGTICRARTRSVPGSKIMRIDDRPGADLEWMVLSHATPLSKSCSIGKVISCSTSSAERPRASV